MGNVGKTVRSVEEEQGDKAAMEAFRKAKSTVGVLANHEQVERAGLGLFSVQP